MKTSDYTILAFGAYLLLLGISFQVAWPYIFQDLLVKKLELTNSSETFKLWQRTPIPMYLELYLFNWTNSREFKLNKSVIPDLQEIGPFVFEEVHQRVNLSWNKDYTVSYNQTRNWTFVPELSVNLSTKITNLNVVATVSI